MSRRELTFLRDEAPAEVIAGLRIGYQGWVRIAGDGLRLFTEPAERCEDCAGWLVEPDHDADASGIKDLPVPCWCVWRGYWGIPEWADYRRRMDRLVAAWVAFHGPPDPALIAEWETRRAGWYTGSGASRP